MRALQLALSVPWAIRPDALQLIVDIASRETSDLDDAARRLAERQHEFDAVSVTPGRPLDGGRTARVRGNVAVLPVEGPIFRYANLFTSISGATSVELLAQDLRAALDAPDVTSILLHVDSPGGEVNGIAEFADMVHQARAHKRVVSYVSNEGASAAYWIASAANEVVCSRTALVGSIGVVAAIPDPTKHDRGVEFVSSQSPRKRPDPRTDAGRAQIQTVVDDLADQFVATVARNRGVSVDMVLQKFGAGDVLVGAKAVNAGLVDRLGDFEGVLTSLNAGGRPAHPSLPRRAAMNAQRAQHTSTPTMSDPTIARAQNVLSAIRMLPQEQQQSARAELVRIVERTPDTPQGHRELPYALRDLQARIEHVLGLQHQLDAVRAEQRYGQSSAVSLQDDPNWPKRRRALLEHTQLGRQILRDERALRP